jgi:hypothetical protein
MDKEIYQCIKVNDYGFNVGQKYQVDRESEIYLPSSESLEVVDIIVFENDIWIPKYDFKNIFRKLDDIRFDKINSILYDSKVTN